MCSAGETASGSAVTSGATGASRWTLSFGYRWQDSFRNFRGNHEVMEGPKQDMNMGMDMDMEQKMDMPMQNKLHLMDMSISYRLSPRWSVHAGIPIVIADRIDRGMETTTRSRGIGDMSVGAKFWLFRPPTESRQNIELGFSLKVPTGNPHVTNVTADGQTITVDQSIQPGDSGTGIALDFLMFKQVQRFTLFGTGVWLMNPRNTYRAPTPGAVELSVSDQYLFRGGVGYAVPRVRGLAFSIAGRHEGVPARDLIGREDGFRRPGYAVSIEPGVTFAYGRHTWSVSAPYAVHRDRTRSVPEYRSGSHGDAAFADYVILVGYSRTF